MMEIFGQPESYSDILKRVLVINFGVGVICTFFLGFSSPEVKGVLDSISNESEIGLVKGMKALYVLIPLIVAILSRIIKLHDKISDLLRIRLRFDTRHILIPLAQGVGSDVNSEQIKKSRNDLMYKVFYPYAGFNDTVIDAQLVRTALDNWGWLWVEVEVCFLCVLTSVIFLAMQKRIQLLISFGVAFVLICLSFYQYRVCIKSAKAEVNAILDDKGRKKEILGRFSSLQKKKKD